MKLVATPPSSSTPASTLLRRVKRAAAARSMWGGLCCCCCLPTSGWWWCQAWPLPLPALSHSKEGGGGRERLGRERPTRQQWRGACAQRNVPPCVVTGVS
jgi:hypothetical protein